MTVEAFDAAAQALLQYERLYVKRCATSSSNEKSDPSGPEETALTAVANILTCAFWPASMALCRAKSGHLKHEFHLDMLRLVEGE
jgi:hypothetical protein